ncbi:glycerophosphodiester phosphodiesterase family protein [Rhizobium sp. LC145]|uniref:glycerophosphodiester phosphodiesterase n=1 Tax=Rhizobium sp. LC145 TaxID=1120688 RepID=UPI000629F326|nr:glycerophosphodiester phosphodiesterase family protein [Rhizobium sp. LC145]KKX27122.1 glycerophosphodiester phosphodiesterase [Rhizobium sp. LC145]TKT56561.1 glycerophosphodiester phosphodiesterase [Rhizobiaceae bacterium LC148]
MTDFPGLTITHLGHPTRLKWHRLRRSFSDPLFGRQTMAEGFRLGASMELDLRVRGDGGFVVLHDEELQGETTGHGLVRMASVSELRGLCMIDGGHDLTLSEDLAAMLDAAHPDALLQFDMKDGFATVSESGMDHIADHFRHAGSQIIISAADLDLVLAVKDRLPGLRRGIDPTDKLVEIYRHEGLTAAERELVADLAGPTEPDTIYLAWQLVLQAARDGLDLIGLCHDHGKLVDAWTYNLKNPETGFSDAEWREFSGLIELKPDQITTDEAPATERAWNSKLAEAA